MEPAKPHATIQESEKSTATRDNSQTSALEALLDDSSSMPAGGNALVSACTRPWALVALGLTASKHESLDVRSIEKSLNDCGIPSASTVKDGIFVAFTSYDGALRFAESVLEHASKAKYAVVVSLPFSDIGALSRQFRLMRYVLDTGAAGLHKAKDHALAYLVSEISKAVDIRSLVHPALEKLRRYDENNQSNLLNTLRVYLEYDRNAQRCASVLYLHRNSLQYRVRRIQEIAGIDLENPDERAYLRLSFLLS